MTKQNRSDKEQGNKDMPYADSDFVTTTIAGRYIGVSRQAIHNMIESKIIKAKKVYQDENQERYVYIIRFGDLKDVKPRTPGDRSTP